MGIAPEHLLVGVIRPALKKLAPLVGVSRAAEQLLLGTYAHESEGGRWLYQQGGGPALGIYQMEPATHDDLLHRWIEPSRRRLAVLYAAVGTPYRGERLLYDLRYATVFARLHYLRVPAPLPAADDWPALAAYWKAHYNTSKGRGQPAQFLSAAQRAGLAELRYA